MAVTSVLFNPAYTFPVDVGDYLTDIPNINAKSIAAYQDSDSNVMNLTVGASRDVNIESANNTNIYTLPGGGVKLYETTIDGATRTDYNILQVTNTSAGLLGGSPTTLISVEDGTSSKISIQATDAQNTVTVGSLKFNDASGYEVLTTTNPNGFKFNKGLNISGSVTATSDFITSGNVKATGDMFASTMNFYKDLSDSNLSQVAYAFYINEYNQLELLRYYKYTASNSAQERVMTFGTASINNGYKDMPVSAVNNYDKLNSFNGITAASSNSNVGGSSSSGSSGNMLVNTSGNMYLNEGVYFGIGTSEPAYELDVNGTIRSSAVVISPQFLTSSDQRLKENIKLVSSYEDCLNTLVKLNVYNYNFKADPDKRLKTGFIAQEVKRQIPNAVVSTDFAGLKDCLQIDTDTIIAFLVASVKALAAKIATQ